MATSTRVFRAAFEPFRYLDLGRLYSAYWPALDLLIYLIFFTGVSLTALNKQFEGRGGKAVIVAISSALALSLTLAEQRFGFRLGDLGIGAFGMGLILLVLVWLLGNLLHQWGTTRLTAYTGAFALIGLLSMGLAPGFWDFLSERVPLVIFLYVLAVLVAVGHLLLLLFRYTTGRSPLSQEVTVGESKSAPHPTESRREKRLLRLEYRMERKEHKTLEKWVRELGRAQEMLQSVTEAWNRQDRDTLRQAWKRLLACGVEDRSLLTRWARQLGQWQSIEQRLVKQLRAEGFNPQSSPEHEKHWQRILKERQLFQRLREQDRVAVTHLDRYHNALREFQRLAASGQVAQIPSALQNAGDALKAVASAVGELRELENHLLEQGKKLFKQV